MKNSKKAKIYITNKKLEAIKSVLETQGESGNWNYSPYMLGLYNGMELALATLEDREPVFKDTPDQWLIDSPVASDDVMTSPFSEE